MRLNHGYSHLTDVHITWIMYTHLDWCCILLDDVSSKMRWWYLSKDALMPHLCVQDMAEF